MTLIKDRRSSGRAKLGAAMDGCLAQVVALVGYGNVFLAGNAGPTLRDLKEWNSTFKHVDEVIFMRGRLGKQAGRKTRTGFHRAIEALRGLATGRKLYTSVHGALGHMRASMQFDGAAIPPEDVIARSTAEWFAYLRACGIVRLAAVRFPVAGKLPAHIAVAFAGHGQFGIGASGKGSGYWGVSWRVKNQAHPQRRIWAVIYSKLDVEPPVGPTPDLVVSANALERAVRDAVDLARAADLHPWPDWFDRSLGILQGRDAPIPYHPDILPPAGYGMEARRLLAAAVQAWVFGGMGSWNDSTPTDSQLRARYDTVTPSLYDAVTHAIVDAANSFGF
jgi:hypothetical protein